MTLLEQAFGCTVRPLKHGYTLKYAMASATTQDLHENDFQDDTPTVRDLDYFVLGVKAAMEQMALPLKGRRIG